MKDSSGAVIFQTREICTIKATSGENVFSAQKKFKNAVVEPGVGLGCCPQWYVAISRCGVGLLLCSNL